MSEHDSRAPSARALAADVVFDVVERGAFVAASLDARLASERFVDPRDAALATELCYGVVRHRGALLARLSQHARHGISDRRVEAHLLVAAYQLLLLDRVPAFAAVDEAVSAISRLRGARVAGFANAVLRRIARGPKPDRSESLRASAPSWLWEALEASVGVDQAKALLGMAPSGEAAALGPEVSLRFVAGSELPEWAEGGTSGRFLSSIRRLRRHGDVRRFPEYAEGRFMLQEEGAALCGLALRARPGERVLDACAGRGQKAALLAERLGSDGQLVATDNSLRKLKQLTAEFERLRLPAPETRVVDWLAPNDPLSEFDRVLVDAPCSGTGTLRRRPEIALRLSPEDVERLALNAERILLEAARRARSGGFVLFAVCSVLSRECESVVDRALASGLLEPVPLDLAELGQVRPEETSRFRLLPGVHGTDGFFLASFRRR